MIKESIHQQRRTPQVLVENKLSFAGDNAQLSIYDTFEQAKAIDLVSDQLMFCGMVSGKKVMHSNHGAYNCDFFPHESFVMAPNQSVAIDFPTATLNQPTTCLAIEMSDNRIKQVCDGLNVNAPLDNYHQEWHYQESLVHTHHNAQTQALLDRMVTIFTENHQDRDFMIDLAVRELIARLLRHQTRDFIISHSLSQPDHNGLNAAIDYLVSNIKEEMNIDELCKKACMSRTKFYTEFKRHLGSSPAEFLFQARLKYAAQLLKNNNSVTQACYNCGFKDTSHFSRSFKRFYGLSPQQFKIRSQ
ncbi:helix-turn-helix domain-containing protein [Psychrobium sp. nBUS_13]|uniref:AraC family transcriptional regulator n=1 Tax=Psychrobium sp. nBUS_13 TaxID=3395319 RepID=UPI003EBD0AEB